MAEVLSPDSTSGLVIMNAELVERIADEILREEAWWIGARSGKYVVKGTLWPDRDRSITQNVVGAPALETGPATVF